MKDSAPDGPPEAASWRDSLTTPRHELEEVLREQEAALVAQAIHTLLTSEGLAPGDIFVLSRKRESLRLVAHALRERRVPYVAVESAALMDAVEARDLVALLDALVSPRHRLSLAQALRSPLFGASASDRRWRGDTSASSSATRSRASTASISAALSTAT